MSKIQIETHTLGMMQVNCYFVMNKETKELLIVDPGDQPQRISQRVALLQAKPVAILLTHGHFDHIGAVDDVRSMYDIPVYALSQEQKILEDPKYNLSGMCGAPFTVTADKFLNDGQEITLCGTKIQVLHTPGHTSGGTCYYLPEEGVLFSGDTLFRCSVGRTDFPTGSMAQIHQSIHEKLFVLPEDTIVYPGHNSATDIKYEKHFNPY